MQYRFCPRCAGPLATQSIESLERLVCSAPGCGFVHWDNPLPVVAALVEYQGQILLARNAQWPRRIFSLVTGFLDQKESPEHAVMREVKEELNLESTVTHFIGHYPFVEMNQIILAFAVEACGELKANHEIAETKLISIEELTTYDFTPLYLTSAIVRDWLARQSLR